MKSVHCRAPFTTLAIRGLEISPCCVFPKDFSEKDIEELRVKLYNNECIPEYCKNCSIKNAYASHRLDEVFERNLDSFNETTGEIDNFKIGHLHITIGNICNAMCKTCNTYNSSGSCRYKGTEEKITYTDYIPYIKDNSNSITEITILGGESFLYRKDIIDICDSVKNGTKIDIFTNGSIYDEEIFNKLSEHNVNLSVSIDGNSKTNHYIRPPLKYDNIVENINRIKNKDKFKLNIMHTISPLNIFDLKKNIEIYKRDFSSFDFEITLNAVVAPSRYSIRNMSDELKNRALSIITSLNRDKTICFENVLFEVLKDNNTSMDSLRRDTSLKDGVLGLDTEHFMDEGLYNLLYK